MYKLQTNWVSQRQNTDLDSDSHHDNGHHHDSSTGSECAGLGSPPGFTWKEFFELDKVCSETRVLIWDVLIFLRTFPTSNNSSTTLNPDRPI